MNPFTVSRSLAVRGRPRAAAVVSSFAPANARPPADAIASPDDVRTYGTIAAMEALAAAGARDPQLRAFALACRRGSVLETLGALMAAVQARVQFVDDFLNPRALGRLCRDCELLIPPAELIAAPLGSARGDCDEFAGLVKSCCLVLGIDACFKTIAADPTTGDFSHVYNMAAGGGVAIDASHGPRLGWEARAGETTRFGDRVGWVGKARVWNCRAGASALHGLGASWSDMLISQIPVGVDTGREYLLRTTTPTGWYKTQTAGPGGTTSQEGRGVTSALGTSSDFPWGWVVAAGVALVVFKSMESKTK